MDKYLIWRLRWVLLRAAGVALVIKGPCQALRKDPRAMGQRLVWRLGGVRLNLLLYV